MNWIPDVTRALHITRRFVRRILELPLGTRRPETSFPGSRAYWQKRYESGGNSGAGSYGKFADFKAEILNQFVRDNDIKTVIEFGSGDGNQLRLAKYPRYTGYDVSEWAVDACRSAFADDSTKTFHRMDEYRDETAELALSLDVIFHLVEDEIYEAYMRRLFAASTRYVIIYSSDFEDDVALNAKHVRHRKFSTWADEHVTNWRLAGRIENRFPYNGDYTVSSFSDFYVFERTP